MLLWDLIQKAFGAFFDLLRTLLPGIVGRVLLTLGIGFASYTVLLPRLVDFLNQYLNSMPADMVAMLGALRVDQALTLMFSAMAVKMGTRVKPIRLGGQDASS